MRIFSACEKGAPVHRSRNTSGTPKTENIHVFQPFFDNTITDLSLQLWWLRIFRKKPLFISEEVEEWRQGLKSSVSFHNHSLHFVEYYNDPIVSTAVNTYFLKKAPAFRGNIWEQGLEGTVFGANNLIELYKAWNKPEKDEEWRAKLLQTEIMRKWHCILKTTSLPWLGAYNQSTTRKANIYLFSKILNSINCYL